MATNRTEVERTTERERITRERHTARQISFTGGSTRERQQALVEHGFAKSMDEAHDLLKQHKAL